MKASVYARNPAALWRRVGDEVLLATRADSEIDQLSVPAAAAWLALAQPRTLAELINVLADQFGVDSDEIAVHVERLIDELETRGLLARSSDA